MTSSVTKSTVFPQLKLQSSKREWKSNGGTHIERARQQCKRMKLAICFKSLSWDVQHMTGIVNSSYGFVYLLFVLKSTLSQLHDTSERSQSSSTPADVDSLKWKWMWRCESPATRVLSEIINFEREKSRKKLQISFVAINFIRIASNSTSVRFLLFNESHISSHTADCCVKWTKERVELLMKKMSRWPLSWEFNEKDALLWFFLRNKLKGVNTRKWWRASLLTSFSLTR